MSVCVSLCVCLCLCVSRLLFEPLELLFELEQLVELGIGFHTCLRCHLALFLDLLVRLEELLLLCQEGRF